MTSSGLVAKFGMQSAFFFDVGTPASRREMGPTTTLLARGASNALGRADCLAPDQRVESECFRLIRGPLFFALTLVVAERAGRLA